jgi:DNA-binding GntR family transcriptional regulator
VTRQPSDIARPRRGADGNGRLIADRAYDELRHRIVTLQLGPGAPLREDVLMAELQLGRTPLREAVKRLALEGLVEIRPRSGTFVTAVEASDIVHIAEVRAELEAQAARLAARRIDDARRAVAADLDEALRAIEGARGADAYMRLDERVHRFVWETAGNPYLVDALERLWALSLRIWHLVIEQVPELPAAVHEQRAILDAVVSGDARRAGAQMRHHVQSFEAGILDAFNR